MSSAPTQIAVASSTSLVSTSHVQKDYLEEPISRQNSVNNRQRGGSKVKHLTRSHAMRESTSPPRTPTPRSELLTPISPTGLSPSSLESLDSRLQYQQQQSSTSSSPLLDTTSGMSHHAANNYNNSSHYQQQLSPPQIFSIDGGLNPSQLDLDFPKLTPPKSKSPRSSNNNYQNSNNNVEKLISLNSIDSCKQPVFNVGASECNTFNSSSTLSIVTVANPNPINNINDSSLLLAVTTSSSSSQTLSLSCNQQNMPSSNIPPQQHTFYERDHRPRDSTVTTGNNSCAYQNDALHCESPTDGLNRVSGSNSGKKYRAGGGAKGTKPRLKTMGSSSSVEGDSSTDLFTDQSGVDLLQFFKETLNKNAKDRNMLMRIEKELHVLALDRSRSQIKFPAMSSYNRMLIHRVAAYFGMEHNVDSSQQSVIAAVTKSTRVPEVRFKSLIRDTFTEEPRKSILKRDAHSFDECRQFLGPERAVLDRKAKSFEEREEEYEKGDGYIDEPHWHWSSSESSDNTARLRTQNNRLLKVQSVDVKQTDGRPCVSKSHSFGGYGGQSSGGPLLRGDSLNSTKSAGARLFSKQDSIGSTNTPWRLSPSSSGYKTQSMRSDSVTPSPTGYGSGDHTPEPSNIHSPSTTCGVVWAVTDMASVPRGSVLIDPQTLQPIVNQDGTIYHFDPSNLPPKSMSTNKPSTVKIKNNSNNSGGISNGNNMNKLEKQKSANSSNETDDPENSENTVVHKIEDGNVIETITVITDTATHNINEYEEESPSPSIEDTNKLTGSNNSLKLDFSNEPQKQQKSQATSPNLPTTEFLPTQHNEITTSQQSANESDTTSHTVVSVSSNSVPSATTPSTVSEIKKDEYKPIPQSAITVMSYAPGYSTIDNSTTTVYPSNHSASFAAYQQGADGSVYAVPQPMMYAYPQSMESEVPGYFVPIYDQSSGQQREPALITQSASTSLYQQPTSGATAVLPLTAYPQPLYQSQVVYTPDQFSGNTGAGQVQQYPLTYPVGYPYTYNGTTYQGYWGQPMTYYVPQSQLATASTPVSTPMIAPSASTTVPHGTNSIISNINHKRGTPPQSTQSQYTTTHSGVPISLSDPPGTTMYAIPPMYSGMVPYTTTPTGVLSHQIQHTQNAVINSVVPPSPQLQIDQSSYHQINTTNLPTPQSAPSTPLSLPLPLPHSKSTPLFATPSIVPNGFMPQMGTVPLQNGGDSNFDRKNLNPNRRPSYINSSTNRQITSTSSTYIPQSQPNVAYNQQKRQFDPSTQRNNIIPPRRNDAFKPQQSTQIVSIATHNYNINNNNNNGGEKIRPPRPKPSNLDLRRSNSNRNTPSTNSTESNNSPNSITSNDQPPIYMTRSTGPTHLSQIHPPTSHIESCHQQLISTYNPGMYVKFGQTYFTHPSMTLSSNRRSPPNEVRPQLTPITGMYPTMNVMLSAPRHITPRPQNPNYKGNKPRTPRYYFNSN